LIPCGKLGFFQEVDYLDPALAGKVCLTDFFKVGGGGEGLDPLVRYIQGNSYIISFCLRPFFVAECVMVSPRVDAPLSSSPM
jgi:hypothetical protein